MSPAQRKSTLELPLDERLYRCPERQVGVWLPIPLSGRLDALTRIGEESWAPTGRKEVISALMLAADPKPEALGRLLVRYRNASVRDAFIDGFEESLFLYPPGSPGPREQLRLWQDDRRQPKLRRPPIPADAPLPTSDDFRTGMQVASPLAGRLRILYEVARRNKLRTSRRELIAAILLGAPAEGDALATLLARYWHATVADAMIEDEDSRTIREIPIRGRASRAERPLKKSRKSTVKRKPGTTMSRTKTHVPPPPDPPPQTGTQTPGAETRRKKT